ncbi:metallopeptidase [Brachybacterium ginsengisoli]|uniref:Metallopeptidase n=1 Tax=Brachybacterium ginsengisoli TaxID=1331682 RepID=A0A291GVJ5_9MICO|nr:MepB family protein [Brachybacterium ginsengisoli]ATG54229.1 metallopeptidase [Brachybacterium ginsengisoli]
MNFPAFETYAAEMGLAIPIAPEEQNSDYESGIVEIDRDTWHIRTARNTPTKPGAFVAFWRRGADGVTTPFSDAEPAAGLLVFVEQLGRRGVFRFTAADLARLGITSGARPGKRGFRVYPSWCVDLNAGATAAQRAQSSSFLTY